MIGNGAMEMAFVYYFDSLSICAIIDIITSSEIGLLFLNYKTICYKILI